MDEAPRASRRGILQPVRGSDFNSAGSCNWSTRVAVPVRRPETEGHFITASSACMRIEYGYLAGLLDAFPRAAAGRSPTELPPHVGISGRRSCRADRAPGWLPKWRQRSRLEMLLYVPPLELRRRERTATSHSKAFLGRLQSQSVYRMRCTLPQCIYETRT